MASSLKIPIIAFLLSDIFVWIQIRLENPPGKSLQKSKNAKSNEESGWGLDYEGEQPSL